LYVAAAQACGHDGANFRATLRATRFERQIFLRAHSKASISRDSAGYRDDQRIAVVEEQVHVDTRPVEIERTRIEKTVRERDVTVDARLMEEELEVERVTLEPPRTVESPPPIRHEGDTTIIPVLEERLVVVKRLVVREELRVKRTRHERRDPQHVVLRSEHVSVTRSPPTQPDADASIPDRKER
jgi:uncharacterized protein (TIGR02271 family)